MEQGQGLNTQVKRWNTSDNQEWGKHREPNQYVTMEHRCQKLQKKITSLHSNHLFTTNATYKRQ